MTKQKKWGFHEPLPTEFLLDCLEQARKRKHAWAAIHERELLSKETWTLGELCDWTVENLSLISLINPEAIVHFLTAPIIYIGKNGEPVYSEEIHD